MIIWTYSKNVMSRYLLLFLLLVSCTQELDNAKAKIRSIVAIDTTDHKANIARIKIRKQMQLLESDSINNTMELLKNVSSMKEVSLKNRLDHVTDSFLIEAKLQQAILKEVKATPLKCTDYDTIIISVIVPDTIRVYDTIPIYEDRKGLFHKIKGKHNTH